MTPLVCIRSISRHVAKLDPFSSRRMISSIDAEPRQKSSRFGRIRLSSAGMQPGIRKQVAFNLYFFKTGYATYRHVSAVVEGQHNRFRHRPFPVLEIRQHFRACQGSITVFDQKLTLLLEPLGNAK